jgi:ketosteroid isomerase-like protein
LPETKRLRLARAAYEAYVTDARDVVERLLADKFVFYSGPDPGIDKTAYFERCWPNHENIVAIEFKRLLESGDEVILTYETTKPGGERYRNTEVLTFDGDQIIQQEVYFGWTL